MWVPVSDIAHWTRHFRHFRSPHSAHPTPHVTKHSASAVENPVSLISKAIQKKLPKTNFLIQCAKTLTVGPRKMLSEWKDLPGNLSSIHGTHIKVPDRTSSGMLSLTIKCVLWYPHSQKQLPCFVFELVLNPSKPRHCRLPEFSITCASGSLGHVLCKGSCACSGVSNEDGESRNSVIVNSQNFQFRSVVSTPSLSPVSLLWKPVTFLSILLLSPVRYQPWLEGAVLRCSMVTRALTQGNIITTLKTPAPDCCVGVFSTFSTSA